LLVLPTVEERFALLSLPFPSFFSVEFEDKVEEENSVALDSALRNASEARASGSDTLVKLHHQRSKLFFSSSLVSLLLLAFLSSLFSLLSPLSRTNGSDR
jgi:hypothetical protein